MTGSRILAVSLVALMLGGAGVAPLTAAQTSAMPTPSTPAAQSESARLNAFFAEVFARDLQRSPMFDTYIGGKENYDKLDDLSDAKLDEDTALVKQDLHRLHTEFDKSKLDDEARLSYRIFEDLAEDHIAGDKWRHYAYPVNQMYGWQSEVPAFLITAHQVSSVSDAEAYVARLKAVQTLIGQVIDNMRISALEGIIQPKFVFPVSIGNARTVINGAPFDNSGEDSSLFADLKAKVGALDIADTEKSRLIEAGRAALLDNVKPAYDNLITVMTEQEAKAPDVAGVWRLPNGAAFYNYRLKHITTTDMTAEQIHDFGLAEMDRIHGEMRALMQKIGFKGSLQDFFKHLRDDQRFYYPNTAAGREAYIKDAIAYIAAMKQRLPEDFDIMPKAEVVVKEVEPFREKGSASAFYQPPSLDGSRPGYFYVNTSDMKQLPKYALEALVYHEAIPGHHMQISIAQELQNIPEFRKFANFTAYIEGWGLYAERLGKEMGFYTDPYSDFGRLSLELWRAARLVVDTGIHVKRWTRDQAVAYMDANTPNPHGDNIREVERYIVMPGQATAYKIGMAKILDAREKARTAMGAKFDIRHFHDVVLKDGALPLSILDERVDGWAKGATAGQ